MLHLAGIHPLLAIDVSAAQLRWEIANIALGVVLLVIGFVGLAIFLARWKIRDWILLYFGIFAVFYAVRLIVQQKIFPLISGVPSGVQNHLVWAITYTIGIPITLFLMELVGARAKKILHWLLGAIAIFSALGLLADIFNIGRQAAKIGDNIAVISVFLAWAVFIVYSLWNLPRGPVNHEFRVIGVGFLIAGLFVLHANLASLKLLPGHDVEPLGIFIFLGCLGYAAAHRTFVNEERLNSIHRELGIARQIQASILPRLIPQIPGIEIAARYSPMSAVAGDFYDFLVLDENRVGILMADVSGHGVPAALIASMLKFAFSAQSAFAENPAQVLSGLNRSLCGKFEDHFVTACYLYIDVERKIARFAGAGHPPMLFGQRARMTVSEMESDGMSLGLYPEAEYPSKEFEVAASGRCLLYTDGVLEATNAAQEEFGKERCKQFLQSNWGSPAPAVADELLKELSRWSEQVEKQGQEDDITLLVVDFK